MEWECLLCLVPGCVWGRCSSCVTPPGIIQFDAAESVFVVHHLLGGQTGEGVTVWWGAAEEEGTGNDVVDLSVLIPQGTV